MTISCGAFDLQRTFKIAPDKLWTLLVDPEARSSWSAPNDDDVLVMDAHDIREGGRDLQRCGPKDAPTYTVETVWYRLAEPDLACFTETVDAEGARIATTLVTYGLTETDTGTRLDVSVQVSSFVGPEAMQDFQNGWTSGLDKLEKLAASQ